MYRLKNCQSLQSNGAVIRVKVLHYDSMFSILPIPMLCDTPDMMAYKLCMYLV